jgi:hypothetical protein
MRSGEMERATVMAQAKRDIANRIRRVCSHYDQVEFDRLVEQMARIDVRYRLRDDWGMLTESRFPERN